MFDGAVSVEELLRRGDFGLGTLAGLDGEIMVLDGTAYQAKGDGSVHALPGEPVRVMVERSNRDLLIYRPVPPSARR